MNSNTALLVRRLSCLVSPFNQYLLAKLSIAHPDPGGTSDYGAALARAGDMHLVAILGDRAAR